MTIFFFFSSRRRHTRYWRDWSSDVCSSDLAGTVVSQRFQSPSLGREWVYNVYLPDGYDSGKLRYPVMYLLHGNGGDENEWEIGRASCREREEISVVAGSLKKQNYMKAHCVS